MRLFVVAAAIGAGLTLANSGTLQAQTVGTPVYSSLPSPIPPNVPSLGYQATQTAEFGDEVKLEASTPRRAGYVEVLMSTWARREEYPALSRGGYLHPITLNIYKNAEAASGHTPFKSVTQTFSIPWRPVSDRTCPEGGYGVGFAWRTADGVCYNGIAFTIVFDLRLLNYSLPNQFIYGIEYNTSTWGYSPLPEAGPYDSLNLGLNNAPPVAVGTDVNPDGVYWNTETADSYADKCVFRSS